MAEVFGDDDADLTLVQERNVVIVGYGPWAHAHAWCLRDSGVDLRIGTDDPKQAVAATADAFRAVPLAEAGEEADLVAVPDPPSDPSALQAALADSLVRGDVVVLGGRVASADVLPPDHPSLDAVRVDPWDDPVDVRAQFSLGRGVAALVSVLDDSSGLAFDVGLGYARGIGATRAGVLRVDEEQAVRARRIGSATVRSALLPAIRAALAELAATGCPPELAFLRCVRDLEPVARALANGEYDDELVESAPYPEVLRAGATLVRSLTTRQSAGALPLD